MSRRKTANPAWLQHQYRRRLGNGQSLASVAFLLRLLLFGDDCKSPFARNCPGRGAAKEGTVHPRNHQGSSARLRIMGSWTTAASTFATGEVIGQAVGSQPRLII